MANFLEKIEAIRDKNNSLVCVGLDVELTKIPKFLLQKDDPIFEFNKIIIDNTLDLVSAYKPNFAFYEAYGEEGLSALRKTRNYIPEDIPVIIDAKRGDIGNTARMSANFFLEDLNFDGITVNPYMGFDAIEPFLKYKDKCIFILCLTSNPSANDFEYFSDGKQTLYEKVATKTIEWNNNKNCGLVVGATRKEGLQRVREIASNLPLLIPGIGAQGGSVEEVVTYGGKNIIINSSRAIIYASSEKDFGEKARESAFKLRDEINRFRKNI